MKEIIKRKYDGLTSEKLQRLLDKFKEGGDWKIKLHVEGTEDYESIGRVKGLHIRNDEPAILGQPLFILVLSLEIEDGVTHLN